MGKREEIGNVCVGAVRTVMDDTFDRYREVIADLILQARQRAKIA
jgi:hypothetical protein